jgi:hypothetical protein
MTPYKGAKKPLENGDKRCPIMKFRATIKAIYTYKPI